MNLPQRIILTIGAVVLVIITLRPPWVYSYDAPSESVAYRPAGFHWITQPPVPDNAERLKAMFGITDYRMRMPTPLSDFSSRIDSSMLAVEVLGCLGVTGVLWLVLKRNS